MKKRLLRYVIFSFLLVALLLVIGGLSPIRYYPGITPKIMAAEVNSNLPFGTSQKDVIAFLDKQHIEHSKYNQKQREISAIVRNTCWNLILECSIDMTFTFNDDGQLLNSGVTEGLTGP